MCLNRSMRAPSKGGRVDRPLSVQAKLQGRGKGCPRLISRTFPVNTAPAEVEIGIGSRSSSNRSCNCAQALIVEYARGSADSRPGIIREPGDGSARRSNGGRKIEGRGAVYEVFARLPQHLVYVLFEYCPVYYCTYYEGMYGAGAGFSRTMLEQSEAKMGESMWERLGHRRCRVGCMALGVVGAK